MRILGNPISVGAVRGRFLRRKPGGETLVSELRALESRAAKACALAGTAYSRAILAGQSGVPKETLSAWIDGQRTPQDSDNLMKIVTVLASLAGQPGPDDAGWRALWAAARQNRGPGKDRAHGKHQKLRRLAKGAAGATVPILLGGFLAPISSNGRGILWNLLSPDPSPTPKPVSEDFEATATWCCRFTMVSENGGFYWKGPAASLDSALGTFSRGHSDMSISDLTPAGSGVIEIQLQTSGTEPIYVAPPQVIVRSRGENVKSGMVAVLPLYPQGSSAPGEFTADVDNASPVTTANGSSGSQYYYVSNTSPEIFILTVEDDNYDCDFDLKLTWMKQGQKQSTLLTNNGHHFQILGYSGLPWYIGNPGINEELKRASGRPFAYYLSHGS